MELNLDEKWLRRMAAAEDGCIVAVGGVEDRSEPPLIITNPKMVACNRCGLLVGWAETPPEPFFCIPCFDKVRIVRETVSERVPDGVCPPTVPG